MDLDTKALVGFFEEIEASRARQKAETELQREVFKRARAKHFDNKAMRIVLQRRAMGDVKRDEQDYNVHAYELALGGKKAAMEALAAGASTREAAKAGGISTGAAAALAKGAQESSFVSTSPHDPETGEISEKHRGAMQPKGCAEVMRADSSMSGSAVASGAAIRDAGAMPLDVAAAPHSEGREHTGSAASAPPGCSNPDDFAAKVKAIAAGVKVTTSTVRLDPSVPRTLTDDDLAIPSFLRRTKEAVT